MSCLTREDVRTLQSLREAVRLADSHLAAHAQKFMQLSNGRELARFASFMIGMDEQGNPFPVPGQTRRG